MCLVSFVPQKNGFILSSNRDETPLRSVCNLQSVQMGKVQVMYPSDKLGGTWLAVSNHGDILCLLNGAFVKHKHSPPYAMSRGIVLLSFFKYSGVSDFVTNFNFSGVEPFTLVIFSEMCLYEFRWDGLTKHFLPLSTNEAHVYSSCTLYTDEVQAERSLWFNDYLLTKPSLSFSDVQHMHHIGGPKDIKNAYLMNRKNIVKTISVSHVKANFEEKEIGLYYEDVHNNPGELSSLSMDLIGTR